jgi:hypothetical protein
MTKESKLTAMKSIEKKIYKINRSVFSLLPSAFCLLHSFARKRSGQASIEMVFVVFGTFLFILADLFFHSIMTSAEFYSWNIRSTIMREYALYRDSFFDSYNDTDGSIGFKTEEDQDFLTYLIKDDAGNETPISVSGIVEGWAEVFNPNGEFHVRYGSVMNMLTSTSGSMTESQYDEYEKRVNEQSEDEWDLPAQKDRLRTLIEAEYSRQASYELVISQADRNVWDNNQQQ